MGSLTPEADLLLHLVRAASDEATRSRTRALVPAVLDWDFFYFLATRHRVASLAYRRLDELGADAVPRPVFMEMWRNYEQNARHSRVMLVEVQRIVDRVEAAGFAVAAYKGPVLSYEAYGAPDLREFEDLDLLVRPRDVDAVSTLLIESGYRRQNTLTPVSEAAFRRSPTQYHLKFVHHTSSIKLELHWRTDAEFPVEQDSDRWWSTLSRCAIGEFSVPTFQPADRLLMLCLHATKHQGHRLGWIAEIAALVRREQTDWRAVMDFAAAQGCARRVLVSLSLAKDLAGCELPEAIEAAMAGDPGIARIAQAISSRLFTRDVDERQGFDRLNVSLQLYDRFPQRLRHVMRVTFEPSLHDWVEHPLPRGLEPFYMPIRVVRLVGKYSSAAMRRAVRQSWRGGRTTPVEQAGGGAAPE